mmetsp:Transcript_71416/g.225538  ORF Transcript_71416/g.225538 Transcript_71416/m.225538 type:complete len:391 (+) Transcript_71416:544-1716(+)
MGEEDECAEQRRRRLHRPAPQQEVRRGAAAQRRPHLARRPRGLLGGGGGGVLFPQLRSRRHRVLEALVEVRRGLVLEEARGARGVEGHVHAGAPDACGGHLLHLPEEEGGALAEGGVRRGDGEEHGEGKRLVRARVPQLLEGVAADSPVGAGVASGDKVHLATGVVLGLEPGLAELVAGAGDAGAFGRDVRLHSVTDMREVREVGAVARDPLGAACPRAAHQAGEELVLPRPDAVGDPQDDGPHPALPVRLDDQLLNSLLRTRLGGEGHLGVRRSLLSRLYEGRLAAERDRRRAGVDQLCHSTHAACLQDVLGARHGGNLYILRAGRRGVRGDRVEDAVHATARGHDVHGAADVALDVLGTAVRKALCQERALGGVGPRGGVKDPHVPRL